MFCINCGTQLPEGARFCIECGTENIALKLTEISNPIVNDDPTCISDSPFKIKKKKKKGKTALIFIIITIIVLSIAVSSVYFLSGEKESPVEDFEYKMSSGKIIITGYIGSEREIVIPKKINNRPVAIIGENAFENYDMTYISLPDTVTTIRKHAFDNCSCLTEINLSDSLTKIEECAFYSCDELKEISFPDSLKSIGKSAFRSCENLSKVEFSDKLEHISDRAFEGCAISTAELPESLCSLGNDAFASCNNLKELYIPDNTDVHIVSYEQSFGGTYEYYGIIYSFESPVGGSSFAINYGSNNVQPGKTDYDDLVTALVVSEGSSAYSKIKPYAHGYGLTVKVK